MRIVPADRTHLVGLVELMSRSPLLRRYAPRNGKQWTFQDINLSLTREKAGGVALTVSSEAAERPWLVRAAMTPGEHGPPSLKLIVLPASRMASTPLHRPTPR